MNKKCSFILVSVMYLLCFTLSAYAQQVSYWPSFRNDQSRSGVNENILPVSLPLEQKWTQFVNDNDNLNIEASPIIADGKVFIAALANNGPNPILTDTLYCLDEQTGDILWSYLTRGMVWVTPTYHNGKLYVVDWEGYIYRFDVSDPDPLNWGLDWEHRIAENPGDQPPFSYWSMRYRSSPLIIEDPFGGDRLIILTSEQEYDADFNFRSSIGVVFCLNPDNPQDIIWARNFGDIYYSSPVYHNGILIVAGYNIAPPFLPNAGQEQNGIVRAIDPVLGNEIWNNRIAPFGAIKSTPTISEDKVYVASTEKEMSAVFCLDLYSGDDVWAKPMFIRDLQGAEQFPEMYAAWSSPTVAYDNLYFASYKTLFAVSLSDPALMDTDPLNIASPIWSFTPGYLLFSSPSVSNGMVFISTDDAGIPFGTADLEDQTFYSLDAEFGDIIWQQQGPMGSAQTSPAIAEDSVIFVSYDGQFSGVYSFKSSDLINEPPVLDTIGNKTVDERSLLEFVITATDPDGDSLTYSASNLPLGASFNPLTKTFSWTPDYDQSGDYFNVLFEVTDGELQDEEYITISVNNVNLDPVAHTGFDQNVMINETVSFDGSFSSDIDGSIVSYVWDFGDGINGSGAMPSHVYTSAGTYTATLTVTDNEGAVDSDTCVITVEDAVSPVQVFYDSFESGQWDGKWVEDSQNDWFTSYQRSTKGSRSAEVDGRAYDSNITSVNIDLQGRNNATITFSWLIEKGVDRGEYLAFDISTNGGMSWTEKARLKGNVDSENIWHHETIEVHNISNIKIRVRGRMSRSNEDANIDDVKIIAW